MVNPQETENREPKPEQKPEQPHLDSDFFSKLVHQPACQTKGICNSCGRCEH